LIFISYASEDKEYAQALYSALMEAGLDPWMDKPPAPYGDRGLRIGDRWQTVLVDKIDRADFIILVLSPRSVAKRGFVQKEFILALGRMDFLPPNEVLVLPVIAEPCEVPKHQVGALNLHDLQWEHVPKDNIGVFAAELPARLEQVA